MNMIRFAAIAMLFATLSVQAATWDVDGAHSTAKFKVRHLMVTNVHGQFKEVKGTVTTDDKDATKLTAEITINPASIDTSNTNRDNHLKDKDFFDVKKFKTITFKSKKSEKNGDKMTLTGDLTMHGVTKEVTFNVDELTDAAKGMDGAPKRGLSASTKINRSDWGLTWNRALETGGVTVSDNVDITVELELNGKKPAEGKKS